MILVAVYFDHVFLSCDPFRRQVWEYKTGSMSTIFRHRLYPIYVEVSYIRDSFTVLMVRGVPYLVHREGNFSRCREGDYMGFIEHYFPFIEHETTLFLPDDIHRSSPPIPCRACSIVSLPAGGLGSPPPVAQPALHHSP